MKNNEKNKFQSTYCNKRKIALEFKDKSLTHQSFKEESLVKNILAKHRAVGIDIFSQTFDLNNDGIIDVSEIPDFHTYQTKLAQAQQSFMQLPAQIRKRFENNPQKMLAFLADSKNELEAVELGLVKKKIEKNDKIQESNQINASSLQNSSINNANN